MGFKLAFCIPVKDAQDYIGKMVESIVGQRVPNDWAIKVVLAVDPKDHFRYREFLAPLLEGHRNFEMLEVHCKKGEGESCGDARNVALRYADSEYVWFVDADDWLASPFAVDCAIKAIEESNADILFFEYECRCHNFNRFIPVWTKVFRKSAALRFPFDDSSDQEDKAQISRIVADKTMKYVQIDAPLYHYNWPRPGSLTNGRILQ